MLRFCSTLHAWRQDVVSIALVSFFRVPSHFPRTPFTSFKRHDLSLSLFVFLLRFACFPFHPFPSFQFFAHHPRSPISLQPCHIPNTGCSPCVLMFPYKLCTVHHFQCGRNILHTLPTHSKRSQNCTHRTGPETAVENCLPHLTPFVCNLRFPIDAYWYPIIPIASSCVGAVMSRQRFSKHHWNAHRSQSEVLCEAE